MKTLRRSIRGLLDWRGQARPRTQVAHEFANDFGLKPDKVAEVFDRAALRLSGAAADPWGIVNDAIGELTKHGLDVAPLNEEALEVLLSAVPEPDRTILNEYRSGKSPQAVAALLGMRKGAVLRSLARTYADLRMKMLKPNGSMDSQAG